MQPRLPVVTGPCSTFQSLSWWLQADLAVVMAAVIAAAVVMVVRKEVLVVVVVVLVMIGQGGKGAAGRQCKHDVSQPITLLCVRGAATVGNQKPVERETVWGF